LNWRDGGLMAAIILLLETQNPNRDNETIQGSRLSVPGIIDLIELEPEAQGVPRIVLESVQHMLLKLAQQIARDDYEAFTSSRPWCW